MGIRSEVRLAAAIPAMRATSRGSPLGFLGSFFSTEGRIFTQAWAVAVRLVSFLAETSTMLARPFLS